MENRYKFNYNNSNANDKYKYTSNVNSNDVSEIEVNTNLRYDDPDYIPNINNNFVVRDSYDNIIPRSKFIKSNNFEPLNNKFENINSNNLITSRNVSVHYDNYNDNDNDNFQKNENLSIYQENQFNIPGSITADNVIKSNSNVKNQIHNIVNNNNEIHNNPQTNITLLEIKEKEITKLKNTLEEKNVLIEQLRKHLEQTALTGSTTNTNLNNNLINKKNKNKLSKSSTGTFFDDLLGLTKQSAVTEILELELKDKTRIIHNQNIEIDNLNKKLNNALNKLDEFRNKQYLYELKNKKSVKDGSETIGYTEEQNEDDIDGELDEEEEKKAKKEKKKKRKELKLEVEELKERLKIVENDFNEKERMYLEKNVNLQIQLEEAKNNTFKKQSSNKNDLVNVLDKEINFSQFRKDTQSDKQIDAYNSNSNLQENKYYNSINNNEILYLKK